MKLFLRLLLVGISLLLVNPENSYAYIDPGTGSYVIQIIIASVLGGLFVLKSSYSKIIDLFKSLFTGHKNTKN